MAKVSLLLETSELVFVKTSIHIQKGFDDVSLFQKFLLPHDNDITRRLWDHNSNLKTPEMNPDRNEVWTSYVEKIFWSVDYL